MSVVALRPQAALDELAETINREHALVLEAGNSLIKHAILVGEGLLDARMQIAPGDWMKWLSDNWSGSYCQARTYIRIARNRAAVTNAVGIKDAIRMLEGGYYVGHERKRSDNAEAVHELRAAGVPVKEIAKELDLSLMSVYRHLWPEEKRRQEKRKTEQRQKAASARRKAERAALERRERDVAMEKAGGDAWDAYVTTRKLAALLDGLGMGPEYAKCVAIEDALVKRVKGA